MNDIQNSNSIHNKKLPFRIMTQHVKSYYVEYFLYSEHCNRRTHIRHQRKKTTVLSCHRCHINTAVEKNEQRLNVD